MSVFHLTNILLSLPSDVLRNFALRMHLQIPAPLIQTNIQFGGSSVGSEASYYYIHSSCSPLLLTTDLFQRAQHVTRRPFQACDRKHRTGKGQKTGGQGGRGPKRSLYYYPCCELRE